MSGEGEMQLRSLSPRMVVSKAKVWIAANARAIGLVGTALGVLAIFTVYVGDRNQDLPKT